MPTVNIVVASNGQKWTVSELRSRLAQVLSYLNPDQEVTFSFSAMLPDYQRATSKPAVLGAPYDLSKPHGEIAENIRSGRSLYPGRLWGWDSGEQRAEGDKALIHEIKTDAAHPESK